MRRSLRGATSEMNSAVPTAGGTEGVTATAAISRVPVRTAAMPNRWTSGCHAAVVRKEKPVALSA
ncbi:hypothetical protein ACFY1B_30105 [Streptomyces mirabilis]|uniref:hypothetical protein n=1 Tax=Streptomyces mirabilis TaxID=68239 RepID=UPI0036BB8CD3